MPWLPRCRARCASSMPGRWARPSLPTQHHELYGALCTKSGLRRFLRLTGDAKLRVDEAAVAREAHLDGTSLLRSSDERLSAEEIATGYKALYEAAAGEISSRRSTCVRSSTGERTASAPTPSSAGSRCCSPGSPRWPRTTPGGACATSSSDSTSSRWRRPRVRLPAIRAHPLQALHPRRAGAARTAPLLRLHPCSRAR